MKREAVGIALVSLSILTISPDEELWTEALCQPGPMIGIGIESFDRKRPSSVLSKAIDGIPARLLSRTPEYPFPFRL
jgi:hypothetical protein